MALPTRYRQSGQTVIEIALVLIIIGLMLGGTLKAEELSNQAKIKRTIRDLDGLAIAVSGYRDRYKHLPGDDPESVRWRVNGVPLDRATGQGNGAIEGGYASLDDVDETRKFWLHLRLAGFIEGDSATIARGSTQPLNASGGIIGVQMHGLGLKGMVTCASGLPAKIAEAIDSQLDDGHATTGKVRAALETVVPMPVASSAPTEVYRNLAGGSYVLCQAGGIT